MIVKKLGMFVSVLLLSAGMHAKAAVLDPADTVNINIGGAVTSWAGNIDVLGTVADLSDDWALSFNPANTNTGFKAVLFSEFPPGVIQSIELYESDGTFVAGSATGILKAAIDGTKSYVLRVVGTNFNDSYTVNLSAVPIPAAAVLFLSALAGFGLLGRRRAQA